MSDSDELDAKERDADEDVDYTRDIPCAYYFIAISRGTHICAYTPSSHSIYRAKT